MTESVEPATPDHARLPRLTTPTWEMELLISGATVFALLQLPGLLDQALDAALPRLDRTMAAMVLLPYLYVRIAVCALIIAFVLHLGLRAYWVALVGLRSVYPEGLQWERARWGPHYLQVMRERVPPQDELVERADNRASLVFAFGVGFALLMLAPLLVAMIAGVPAFVAWWALDGRVEWIYLWQASLLLLSAPFIIATLVDRYAGHRWPSGGRASRVLNRIYRAYLRGGFGTFSTYPMIMLATRYGNQRASLLIMAVTVVLAVVALLRVDERLRPGFDSYAATLAPMRGAERTLQPDNYADQRRDDGAPSTMPFIPSDVVDGDWLKLFVPLHPARDNALMREHCPDALQAGRGEPAAALDCLMRLRPLALDGEPLQDVRYELGEDARSGLRGLVAMIPVAGLAPGRHELRIEVPTPPGSKPDPERDAPHRIAFWR